MKKRLLILAATCALLLCGAAIIGYQDFQKRSTPGNPASNYLRMFADSSSGLFKCLTSAGAACYFDSANSGTVTSVVIAGTSNQINVSGTCTITTTGTCTPALSSTLTLPGTLNKITFTAPSTAGAIAFGADNSTATLPNGTVTKTVWHGTSALGTSAIASGDCATVVSTSATGVLTTDNIIADFNADPTAVTGYVPSTSGMLTIIKYPTADHVNYKVCNNTGSSITPGAVTLNGTVVR